MSWKFALLTLALLAPVPRSVDAPVKVRPPVATAVPPAAPAKNAYPIETWGSARDARSLAAGGDFVWVATGGGVDRYAHDGSAHRHFGTAEGLDTLDARSVEVTNGNVVARTGTSRCELGSDHFVCKTAKAPPPSVTNLSLFRGHPIAARLRVGNDEWIATRGGGAFLLPNTEASKAVALESTTNDPSSFFHTGAVFGNAVWLGTFHDGLYRVPLDSEGKPSGSLAKTAVRVTTPARLVNRLVATSGKDGALYVAASEGLFVTRDGVRFTRVDAIAPHAMTGLSFAANHLWATSTEALYRLASSGRGQVERSFVRPAGTHAIQAVAVDDGGTAWLATEDRGVVRVDIDGTIRSYDRVAGLPSSWFVAVETDGSGGVIASTLRHGTVRIASDGSWSTLAWAPNPWGLAVRRDGQRVCIATQGGAACRASDTLPTTLALLPDPRVHLVVPLGPTLLVGTEAGSALYPL